MSASDYAGEVSSAEAFKRLGAGNNAVLLDVRTRPEWQFVGVPDLRGIAKQTLFLSWQEYPDMAIRDDFVEAVRAEGIAADQDIYVICRSGARSRSAAIALTAAGFTAWNVSDGFEGPLDDVGHRGRDSGWKAAGLPWVQQ
ncbi:MAG: rhodanese-like domain-containing protein [Alphaproteobacteria bacterium]